jgi:hypothetical protein
MANFPTTPYQTTLSAALGASDIVIKTAASTGFEAGKRLVIGKEVCLLTKVDTTNHTHEVKRGMAGTAAKAHASGAIVTLGTAATFGPVTKDGVAVAGYDGTVGSGAPMNLPIGSRFVDPDSGYEYLLCDSPNATLAVGDWVAISAAGAASALAVASRGRVGVVVEAPGASDRLFWVAVVGSFSAQMHASVTSATHLVTGVLMAAPGTTCELGGYVIAGASVTAAPTTGILTTGLYYATVVLSNPYVQGVKGVTNGVI